MRCWRLISVSAEGSKVSPGAGSRELGIIDEVDERSRLSVIE